MKKAFLVVFSLFTLFSFGQKINDYEFVMVPMKFKFQSIENEYRLNTLLKFRLEEYGFKAFYTAQNLNTNYEDRCRYLTVDLINDNGFLNTKMQVVFKDCNGIIVFQSQVGMSKDKDYKNSYVEALEIALKSIKALNYKFNGKETRLISEAVDDNNDFVKVEKTVVLNENSLFAQPITNGFQLIDITPKLILKIFRTTQVDFYIANSDSKTGVVFKKNNEWFFEYYLDEKLVSEKLIVKF